MQLVAFSKFSWFPDLHPDDCIDEEEHSDEQDDVRQRLREEKMITTTTTATTTATTTFCILKMLKLSSSIAFKNHSIK